MKSWLDRLLEFAISLLAAAWLLNWAWQLLRPLIPMLAIGAALVTGITMLVQRKRNW